MNYVQMTKMQKHIHRTFRDLLLHQQNCTRRPCYRCQRIIGRAEY